MHPALLAVEPLSGQCSEAFQFHSVLDKWLQGVTGGDKGLQGITGGSKELQEHPRGYMGLQDVTGGYKR